MGEDGVEVVAAKPSHKSGHQSGLQRHPGHRIGMMLYIGLYDLHIDARLLLLVTLQRETLGNWPAS